MPTHRPVRAALPLIGLALALIGCLAVATPAVAAAAPTVTSVSPAWGSTAGGTRVTIRGTGFSKVTGVRFGTRAGTSVKVGSTTRLTVIAPKHAAGTVAVRVLTKAGSSAATAAGQFRYTTPLSIDTKTLPAATAGLPYLQPVAARGGVAPYSWSAKGLPATLTLDAAGVLRGTPAKKATVKATLTVRDAAGAKASRAVTLTVSTALSASCLDGRCVSLTARTGTVPIDPNRVGKITRAADGSPSSVLVTGTPPAVGDTVVVGRHAQAPSGLVARVDQATTRPDGTTLLNVSRAGPGAAYSAGSLVRTGPILSSAAATSTPALDCGDGVRTDLHGLNVTPALRPRLALRWDDTGLNLFQVDLEGDITVDLGVSVSRRATCTLDLPTYRSIVTTGDLGALVLDVRPTATYSISGRLDIRTSVTFRCGAQYRLRAGRETRSSFCRPVSDPLRLTARDADADATVSTTLDTRATFADRAFLTGSLVARVHAGTHPAARPVTQLDGRMRFGLTGCPGCLWSDSPMSATVVSATLYDGVLDQLDAAPIPVPDAGPPVLTRTSLPDATLGEPYDQPLATADNRSGDWAVTLGALPDGIVLAGDRIKGKGLAVGHWSAQITFTDTLGRTAARTYSLDVVSEGDPNSGAVQNLDYCRSTYLHATDDNSSDAVALPFALNFHGTTYNELYVSNNGFVVLDGPSGAYTPYSLIDGGRPIIAPFFADVDTRTPDSALATYGISPDGTAFCVNWIGVGYFARHTDKKNEFQLVITSRPEAGAGAFDIRFNYAKVDFETGDASGGVGGVGGTSARVGYTAGTRAPDTALELPGSGVSGDLLDGGPHALINGSVGSSIHGRYNFKIRN